MPRLFRDCAATVPRLCRDCAETSLHHARNRAAGTDQNKGMETVFNAKRLIDRKIADPAVQADMKLCPLTVLSGSGDEPMIQVHFTGEEKQFHPEASRRDYRSVSGHRGEKRTRDCASTHQRLAAPGNQKCKARFGLESVEDHQRADRGNTSFANWKKERERNVLMYDMGGGTLTSRTLETKVAAGDTHLGDETSTTDLRKKTRLKTTVIPLSSFTEAIIEIDPLFEDSDLTLSLSKARFEELDMDYFQTSTGRSRGEVPP